MADKTGIQWTEQTWNPTTGCDRVSPGCDNCYALKMAKRLKGMGSAKYQTDGDPRTSGPGFGIATHASAITEPLHWKKPRLVFVNSMSDLFHPGVHTTDLHLIFGVMAATPQHTYQILTKRHGRMRSLLNDPQFAHMARHRAEQVFGLPTTTPVGWPLKNVWLGVSVEDQKWADIRIPALLGTPAAIRFLSCEPLLGPVRLYPQDHADHERDWDGADWVCLHCSTDQETVAWRTVERSGLDIDWTIIGGESGPGARPMETSWVADLIEDSRTAEAAPFVKQLGSIWAHKNNASDSKGGKPADWPEALRVREFPNTDISQATS